MKNIITLGIVDDHALFRAGIRMLLQQIEDFEIILEATNGQELLNSLEDKQPDVILLDVDMPLLDGIKTTEIIRQKYPKIKVIILTLHDDDRFVIHLMEVGANGYLLKDSEPEEVEKAIRVVWEKEHYFTDFISKIMFQKATKKTYTTNRIFNHKTDLSERELDVLFHICEGLTNAEIAEKVYLSARTIEGHRLRIMEKLNVKNTASLVAYAIKNHLV